MALKCQALWSLFALSNKITMYKTRDNWCMKHEMWSVIVWWLQDCTDGILMQLIKQKIQTFMIFNDFFFYDFTSKVLLNILKQCLLGWGILSQFKIQDAILNSKLVLKLCTWDVIRAPFQQFNILTKSSSKKRRM